MADNTIDREIQSLLETYIPDIRDNCHECFGDGRFRHSRKEKRDAAKQGLQNLIAQEANKELDRYLVEADPNLIDYAYIKSRQSRLTADKEEA